MVDRSGRVDDRVSTDDGGGLHHRPGEHDRPGAESNRRMDDASGMDKGDPAPGHPGGEGFSDRVRAHGKHGRTPSEIVRSVRGRGGPRDAFSVEGVVVVVEAFDAPTRGFRGGEDDLGVAAGADDRELPPECSSSNCAPVRPSSEVPRVRRPWACRSSAQRVGRRLPELGIGPKRREVGPCGFVSLGNRGMSDWSPGRASRRPATTWFVPTSTKPRVAQLQRGENPDLRARFSTSSSKRTRKPGASSSRPNVAASIRQAEIVFIGVGTPPRADGGADLRHVDAVAEKVAESAEAPIILVLKSTVPVGTNARVRRIVEGSEHPVHVVSNPEFLKEGQAVQDFLKPDRVVIGCDEDDTFARDRMARLYHPFTLDKPRIHWMDPASAELTKYVANTMLAMRISFMNEVAMLCEKVGGRRPPRSVRRRQRHPDRDPSSCTRGPGTAAHVSPKTWWLWSTPRASMASSLELASSTDRANQRQKGVLARKLRQHFGGDVRGRRIAIWGIAFKPQTDDIRESAAVALIDSLVADGADVRAHDPEALHNARDAFGEQVTLTENAYDAVDGADALVLATEWREYLNPDFSRIKSLLRNPVLVDGRNIWSNYGLRKQGFTYEGIGVVGS